MTITDFKQKDGQPVQNIVAFYWLSLDKHNDFKVPFQYFESKKLGRGKACFGKVIATGPKTEFLKKDDIFYFNEFEADTGMWLKEDKIYFIEEDIVEIKFLNIPKEWVYRT